MMLKLQTTNHILICNLKWLCDKNATKMLKSKNNLSMVNNCPNFAFLWLFTKTRILNNTTAGKHFTF